jgi:hypothetical protein
MRSNPFGLSSRIARHIPHSASLLARAAVISSVSPLTSLTNAIIALEEGLLLGGVAPERERLDPD